MRSDAPKKKVEDRVVMKICGRLVNWLVVMDPACYKDYVIIERGQMCYTYWCSKQFMECSELLCYDIENSLTYDFSKGGIELGCGTNTKYLAPFHFPFTLPRERPSSQ